MDNTDRVPAHYGPANRGTTSRRSNPTIKVPAHGIRDVHIDESRHPKSTKDGLARSTADNPTSSSRPISHLSLKIRGDYRLKSRWLRAKNGLILQGKAFCRGACEGSKERGSQLFETAVKGKAPQLIMAALAPYIASIQNFDPLIKEVSKRLDDNIKGGKKKEAHPLYSYVKAINGFGPGNLASIVGECGDIEGYKNPSALWKRMGLAVIDGERQRKCVDAKKAEKHGYSPRRRSIAYLLAESLLKAKKKNAYGKLYDEHKDKQLAQGLRKKHAHDRAMRYIAKRALLELWREARRVNGLPYK